MKPLPPESRPASPAAPSAWLLREIAVVLAIKVVALAALWWAFFSPSSEERPLPADAGRSFLERQPVSPDTNPRSTE
jgi:cytoskeletal protein RodZ